MTMVKGRSVVIDDKRVCDGLSMPTRRHGLPSLLSPFSLDLWLFGAILRFGLPIRPDLPDSRQVPFFLAIDFSLVAVISH